MEKGAAAPGTGPVAEPLEKPVLRRSLTLAAATVGASAAVLATAAPASADGCGTVYIKGHNTVEVCNPILEQAEDLLELS